MTTIKLDFFPLPPFSSFPLSLATRSNNARKKSPPPPPRDYLTRVKTPLRITPTIDRFGSKEGRGEGDKVASETKIKQKKDQFFSPPLFSSPLAFLLHHLSPRPSFLPRWKVASVVCEHGIRGHESLYHRTAVAIREGLTVLAIYCGHIFILTLIATWYRPRA